MELVYFSSHYICHISCYSVLVSKRCRPTWGGFLFLTFSTLVRLFGDVTFNVSFEKKTLSFIQLPLGNLIMPTLSFNIRDIGTIAEHAANAPENLPTLDQQFDQKARQTSAFLAVEG